HPLDIGLACDLDSARALACALLGLAPADCDDALALDALGEMVNVLMGYAVREVLPDDDASYLALPPDHAVPASALAADRKRSIAVLLGSQLGDFVLLLARPQPPCTAPEERLQPRPTEPASARGVARHQLPRPGRPLWAGRACGARLAAVAFRAVAADAAPRGGGEAVGVRPPSATARGAGPRHTPSPAWRRTRAGPRACGW